MEAVHRLTRQEARRIAVRAQLLDAARPDDVVDTVRHLTQVQVDLTAAVAPSADLVLWSRIGPSYDPGELRDALDEQRLVELRGFVRPMADLPLFRAEMAEWPGTGELRDWQHYQREWVRTNESFRQDVLALLRTDGPLVAADLPDTSVVPWQSSGWNANKNVAMLLDLLTMSGEVAVAGRRGRERLWDLASRVYPDEPAVPTAEARRTRAERLLRAMGIARARGPEEYSTVALDLREVGEPAVVEGVRGTWRVDPAQLGRPFRGRTALLSPLDRLVADRKRMTELFEFDYQLEMYKPASARRWGYWALPVLHGDRLVGKVDATTDRDEGVLRVAALHRDVVFTAAMESGVRRELDSLARWLDVELVLPD